MENTESDEVVTDIDADTKVPISTDPVDITITDFQVPIDIEQPDTLDIAITDTPGPAVVTEIQDPIFPEDVDSINPLVPDSPHSECVGTSSTFTSTSVPNLPVEDEPEVPFWLLARSGIGLLLNNKRQEAEDLFCKYPDSIQMYSGYATSLFIDALMTYEDDKLASATHALKETEKKCAGGSWFKSGKTKLFGNEPMTYAHQLEMQTIQADAQLYLAALIFLQQDISSYFKGGWMLRKSWRRYQSTYTEVLSLYKKIVGEIQVPEIKSMKTSDLESSTVNIAAAEHDKNEELEETLLLVAKSNMKASMKDVPIIRNGYIPKSHTIHFPSTNPPDSNSISSSISPSTSNNSLDPSSSNSSTSNSLKKSQSVNSALSKYTLLQKKIGKLAPLFGSTLSFSSIANLIPFSTDVTKTVDIDKDTISRLMCGISFGYGLLQLGLSLIPPSVVKLTSILGFSGNRKTGLANLVYARNGKDMRAPLATLALLWYHTIVRPFFALDGNNVQAGVATAAQLIEDSAEYRNSSIFLFFKGRVNRLNSNIPAAIEAFQASVDQTEQREIKLLSLHDLGWCYFIELRYNSAHNTFSYMKLQSRWSRAFYSYLSIIASGSNDTLQNKGSYEELKKMFAVSLPKGTQLDEFLVRRFKICPATEATLANTKPIYWKLLVYELLYLWNSLPSCSTDNIAVIIDDCEFILNEKQPEPFIGLSALLSGSAYCILKNFQESIACFRKCLELRKQIQKNAGSDDSHINAFALYELGQILIRTQETKAEGKEMLKEVNSIKNYDFDQRLTVRIHSILKHL